MQVKKLNMYNKSLNLLYYKKCPNLFTTTLFTLCNLCMIQKIQFIYNIYYLFSNFNFEIYVNQQQLFKFKIMPAGFSKIVQLPENDNFIK